MPNLQAAAKSPNIYCKLSGMITEADWHNWTAGRPQALRRDRAGCFGPQRCMFGSDWPVCELAGSYQAVHQALLEALGPISAADREQIFGKTAAEFYRLPL